MRPVISETSSAADEKLCDALAALAVKAGAKIMDVYGADFEAERKSDDSPVTAADRIGEAIILEGLNIIAPETPVLAEEAASEGQIPTLGREFFLVDPLDGTKEFINRTGEFTVNIALVRDARPALGVVYAPAAGKLYGGVVGAGAWRAKITDHGSIGERKEISVAEPVTGGLIAVASRSHRSPETDDYLKKLDIADFAAAGSSLKFCLIAEGAAHIYPRFGRTMEWDTGAGQAVLEAAGGKVLTHPEATPLAYNKKERGFDNPHFIASCD
jgi:3'(2'),5'-bisphosphate nucleotidase